MDNKYFCRVCGYHLEEAPWGEDDLSPSWGICDCCGAEFGCDDYSIESIKEYRNRWLNSGCHWFSQELKPKNWSYQEQLKNIL